MLKIQEDTKARFEVAESIFGTFYYHLRRPHDLVGLCGESVMFTSIPVRAWGSRTHIKERWCSRCETAALDVERADIKSAKTGNDT